MIPAFSRLILGIFFLGLIQGGDPLPFDVRARQELLFGKGKTSNQPYYDVVITRQPETGVAIKLPYTVKGGRFHFDLHHRVALTPDFVLPAEVTTVVEVLTGGTNSLGVFTISGTIDQDSKLKDEIVKVSTVGTDQFVIPMGSKAVTLVTNAGPQSISIVGKSQTIIRNGVSRRIEAPGERIAVISNLRFEDAPQTNPLKLSTP